MDQVSGILTGEVLPPVATGDSFHFQEESLQQHISIRPLPDKLLDARFPYWLLTIPALHCLSNKLV